MPPFRFKRATYYDKRGISVAQSRLSTEDDIKLPLSPNYPQWRAPLLFFSGMVLWAYEMAHWVPQMARLVYEMARLVYGKDLLAYEKVPLAYGTAR